MNGCGFPKEYSSPGYLFQVIRQVPSLPLLTGFLKVARVLKDDGIFLYVTFRQPHFVKPLLNRNDRWDLILETLSDGEGSFDYYGFVLRKKR